MEKGTTLSARGERTGARAPKLRGGMPLARRHPPQGAETIAVSKKTCLFEALHGVTRAVLQDPRPVLPLHGQALP